MFMSSFFLLLLLFSASVFAGCPTATSLYNPGKVNCPKCSFLPASQALKISGTTAKIACPSGYEVWYYDNKGKEFVAPVAALKGADLKCSGSSWNLLTGGRTIVLSAIACAKE